MREIYFITGPTAVGKTALSLDWAERNHAEIVSCDSLLFYRGMDIGTAKPTPEELARIPHHCIDLVDPSQSFNVARYMEAAASAIEDIHGRGRQVLVTGGSGFYLKSFFAQVVDSIAISRDIEEKVDQLFSEEGLSAVVDWLCRISPDAGSMVDLKNSRRVLPALKRCLATGKSVAELKERMEANEFPFRDFRKRTVLLSRSEEALKNRIEQRTREMIRSGLREEVEELIPRGLRDNASARNAIGYRETLDHIDGLIGETEWQESINRNTIALVKKQLKWFRNQLVPDDNLDLDAGEVDVDNLFREDGA